MKSISGKTGVYITHKKFCLKYILLIVVSKFLIYIYMCSSAQSPHQELHRADRQLRQKIAILCLMEVLLVIVYKNVDMTHSYLVVVYIRVHVNNLRCQVNYLAISNVLLQKKILMFSFISQQTPFISFSLLILIFYPSILLQNWLILILHPTY